MANNQAVVDIKPRNKQVLDIKPQNNQIIQAFGQERFYTVVIPNKSPYGLLLALTQPIGGTVQSSKSY